MATMMAHRLRLRLTLALRSTSLLSAPFGLSELRSLSMLRTLANDFPAEHCSRIDSFVHRKDLRPFGAVQMPLRRFSLNVSSLPQIRDPDVEIGFKDIMGTDWDEIPEPVKITVSKGLSKKTDDKAGQEALANAWRAAEAVEQFSGVLESLRMELDELSGNTGENVRPLPEELQGALQAAYKRYSNYLNAFGSDEAYLRKKVETELGRHMIYLKMRCSGLDSEWGKVTLIGTSGIAGSYIEHRSW